MLVKEAHQRCKDANKLTREAQFNVDRLIEKARIGDIPWVRASNEINAIEN